MAKKPPAPKTTTRKKTKALPPRTRDHRPTPETRLTVEQMRAVGETGDTIARALQISRETLYQHYKTELEDGRSNRRREVVDLMFKAAKAGNVSAQKRLEEMMRTADAVEAVGKRGKEKSAPAPAALGKKEERQAAANRVGGKFAPPPTPAKFKVVGGTAAAPTADETG